MQKETCGAKTRSGGTCSNPPMSNGSRRCRMHGGASKRGAEHPGFTTGRYSKHLPTALLPSFQEAIADPDLLSLRSEIALATCQIDRIIEAAQGDPAKLNWGALMNVMEAKRKLHESEAKRLQLLGGFVEVTQMVSLLSSFTYQIKLLLEDDDLPRAELLPRIQKILSAMLYRNHPQEFEG